MLRTGGTAGALGCVVKAPSTLGTFLRSFRGATSANWPGSAGSYWPGSGQLGPEPGDDPLTLDLDSTICET